MVNIDIYTFPKFISEWIDMEGYSGDAYLRSIGYESAEFDHNNELAWSMNEKDYTMFLLRFGQ